MLMPMTLHGWVEARGRMQDEDSRYSPLLALDLFVIWGDEVSERLFIGVAGAPTPRFAMRGLPSLASWPIDRAPEYEADQAVGPDVGVLGRGHERLGRVGTCCGFTMVGGAAGR